MILRNLIFVSILKLFKKFMYLSLVWRKNSLSGFGPKLLLFCDFEAASMIIVLQVCDIEAFDRCFLYPCPISRV